MVIAGLVFSVAAASSSPFPVPCAVVQCFEGRVPDTYPASSSVPVTPRVASSPTPAFLNTFTASATFAVDDETGAVVWDVSSTVSRPLASIAKLMSALVLSELPITWTATTTVIESDSDGSNTHIKVGETYSFKTLWNVALIGSSNTAIEAMVRSSGVTREQFVELMNKKAARLAMPSLHFVEPTGLDPRNVGTARDVARLLRFALKNEIIRPVLERQSVTLYPPLEKPRVVWSTNWLLTKWMPHSFVGKVVGKTGYIGDSGYNLAVRIVGSSGQAVRVVVLGAGAPEARFIEAKAIGEWLFSHVVWSNVSTSTSSTSPTSSSVRK